MAKLPEPFDTRLWQVETDIEEHRFPNPATMHEVVSEGIASPLVQDYLARRDAGLSFRKGKKKTIGKIIEQLELAEVQICEQRTKAKRAGEEISLTQAVNRASDRPYGLNKNVLWDMVKLYRDVHNGREI